MGVISAIRSELVKVKHTPFWAIHAAMPLIGATLFTLYFVLYGGVDGEKKRKLILELTAMVFPLLIGVVVGLNISLEEKASHFQTLLAIPSRGKMLLAKLIVLYGAGIMALIGLFAFSFLGISLVGQAGSVSIPLLGQAVLGMALGSFIFYILHLFLSLKFGLGISLFWGVFESLQCIMYSNIELQGAARYIPFAWPVDWIHDILNHTLAANRTEWMVTVILTAGVLLAVIRWFHCWEGRKNYE